MHLATEDVDRGPVLSFCTVPITGGAFAPLWAELDQESLSELKATRGEELELFQRIRQAQFQREPYLLLETLRSVAKGQVILRGGHLTDGAGHPISTANSTGLCLDEDILKAMAADGLELSR